MRPGVGGSGLGGFLPFGWQPPVLSSPPHDVGTFPDFAHGEVDRRRGEVGPRDDLLDALPAHSEQLADLCGAHQVMHAGDHRQQTTSHLTRGPAREDTSHVTSSTLVFAAWHPRCVEKRRLGVNCTHAAFHGIGCEEYAELVAAAGDVCQICGVRGADTARGELVIDHVPQPQGPEPHKVRGLLCDKCNSLMSKVDGTKPWDANRSHEDAARRYAENAWYLTHPLQPPHRTPDEITSDVKFGFMGYASTSRVHRLRSLWVEGSENRAACGNRLWLPAHPGIVKYYRPCKACTSRSLG